MKGIVLVDKPSGMTSHDVVDRVRRAAGMRRVGHTGTLDPNATGLLIVCLGKATRLSEHLTRLRKVYEGTMRFGTVTDSYDLDGEVVETHSVPELDEAAIQAACAEFTGDIAQVPPMVSAVKIGGERLYKLARKGETVERPPRAVTVHAFKVLEYESPDAKICVDCTSGTYVRSLCHDVGQKLGCGAMLATLRRTAVGPHHVKDAVPLDALTDPETVANNLVSIDQALDMPEVAVNAPSIKLVGSGSMLTRQDLQGDCPVTAGWVQLKNDAGELLALGQVQADTVELSIHPKRVMME